MKEIVVIDNKDIKVTKLCLGKAVISTQVAPKVPLPERTPEYDKKYAKWL